MHEMEVEFMNEKHVWQGKKELAIRKDTLKWMAVVIYIISINIDREESEPRESIVWQVGWVIGGCSL